MKEPSDLNPATDHKLRQLGQDVPEFPYNFPIYMGPDL